MKQSELLLKISSELPFELIINIYSYCEYREKKSILKIIFTKLYFSFKKCLRYFICLLFISYIVAYWTWIVLNSENKDS